MRLSKLFAPTTVLVAASIPFAVGAADLESLPDASVEEPQAAEQCQSDLGAFEEELARAGYGVLPPGGYGLGYTGYGVIGTPRQQMQALRDAADIYAAAGEEEACQVVLASMRRIYERHDRPVGLEADDPAAWQTWRRAHLATAEPMTEMDRLMRADVIMGADLRTSDDERLGEIEDVVLDSQRQSIAYVLVSRGGFLGLGKDLVAVRWADLRVTEDHEIFVLAVSPEAFVAAPTVERGNFAASAGQEWRDSLDRYWAGVLDAP